MSQTQIVREGTRSTVQPPGDIVMASVPELRATLREEVAAGAREVTLDFGGVHMVDSTGIGLLVAAHNSLLKVGGKLEVIRASQEILELFRTMRIHQHFNVSGE